MKNFENKVAAITGAGSGMGRELAVQLAKRGCAVAISDVNEKGLAETADLVRAVGVKVTTCKVDVANREAVHAWADEVVRDHGKVNLIFNNAGVALASTIDGASYKDFEWLMGINFWGVVYGTKAFLPHLKASGDGHIVNISSILGISAAPGQGVYSSAKFAVRGFTSALRQELDLMPCGVSATCVHPGGIKTNIAKTARTDASVESLGVTGAQAAAASEKGFITTAEVAALAMIRAVERNQRRLLIGPDARFMDFLVRLMPSLYERAMSTFQKRAWKQQKALQPSPQKIHSV